LYIESFEFMLVSKMVALQEVITITNTYWKDNNSECIVRSDNVGKT